MIKLRNDVLGQALKSSLINLGKDVASVENIDKTIIQTLDEFKEIDRKEFIHEFVNILYKG
jgi:hypothetical protein